MLQCKYVVKAPNLSEGEICYKLYNMILFILTVHDVAHAFPVV